MWLAEGKLLLQRGNMVNLEQCGSEVNRARRRRPPSPDIDFLVPHGSAISALKAWRARNWSYSMWSNRLCCPIDFDWWRSYVARTDVNISPIHSISSSELSDFWLPSTGFQRFSVVWRNWRSFLDLETLIERLSYVKTIGVVSRANQSLKHCFEPSSTSTTAASLWRICSTFAHTLVLRSSRPGNVLQEEELRNVSVVLDSTNISAYCGLRPGFKSPKLTGPINTVTIEMCGRPSLKHELYWRSSALDP